MLASDLADLAREAQRTLQNGADYLHLDVMDGVFVPNITWGPPVVECLRKHVEDAFFDCHMMVSKPLEYVKPMAKAGGSQYTFHIEAVENPKAEIPELCDAIRKNNMKVGIALSPETEVEALSPFVSLIDMVLIMTVKPGFGGQKFMPNMMPKILTLREAHPTLDIGVDGGLGPGTVDAAARAGANMIVAGSACFKPGARMDETIMVLRRSVQKHGHKRKDEDLSPIPAPPPATEPPSPDRLRTEYFDSDSDCSIAGGCFMMHWGGPSDK